MKSNDIILFWGEAVKDHDVCPGTKVSGAVAKFTTSQPLQTEKLKFYITKKNFLLLFQENFFISRKIAGCVAV